MKISEDIANGGIYGKYGLYKGSNKFVKYGYKMMFIGYNADLLGIEQDIVYGLPLRDPMPIDRDIGILQSRLWISWIVQGVPSENAD